MKLDLRQQTPPPVKRARIVLLERRDVPTQVCRLCLAAKYPEEFYKSDRRTCKECIKKAARANRLGRIKEARAYDRARASHPERVAARSAYRRTDAFRVSHNRATRKYAVSHAKRRDAHIAVGNAVKYGRLAPWPVCALPVCDCTEVEAHHPDYDQPLDVVWLCNQHHRQAHREA